MRKWLFILVLFQMPSLMGQQWIGVPDFVEINLFIHTIGIPDGGLHFSSPISNRIGGGVVTGWDIKANDKSVTSFQIAINYHSQKKLHYGFNLHGEVVKSFKVGDSFLVNGSAGSGYLHLFEQAPIYHLKSGDYKKKKDFGRPQLIFSLGIGFAFRFNKTSPYWITAKQQVLAQFPFAKKSGLPLLFHNRTNVGLRRFINTAKNE